MLHLFLLFEGSDCRKNMEITMGDFTEAYRNLIDQKVQINKSDVIIKTYSLFDLSALNCLIGKQNHSATFPCAWTNVSKDHLSSNIHSCMEHTMKMCTDIKFLNIYNDYEVNIAKHVVNSKGKNMTKTGKEFGSIISNNLVPMKDIFN